MAAAKELLKIGRHLLKLSKNDCVGVFMIHSVYNTKILRQQNKSTQLKYCTFLSKQNSVCIVHKIVRFTAASIEVMKTTSLAGVSAGNVIPRQ